MTDINLQTGRECATELSRALQAYGLAAGGEFAVQIKLSIKKPLIDEFREIINAGLAATETQKKGPSDDKNQDNPSAPTNGGAPRATSANRTEPNAGTASKAFGGLRPHDGRAMGTGRSAATENGAIDFALDAIRQKTDRLARTAFVITCSGFVGGLLIGFGLRGIIDPFFF